MHYISIFSSCIHIIPNLSGHNYLHIDTQHHAVNTLYAVALQELTFLSPTSMRMALGKTRAVLCLLMAVMSFSLMLVYEDIEILSSPSSQSTEIQLCH